MRKHPVIYGLCLVFLIGLLASLLFQLLSTFRGESGFLSNREKIGVINIRGVIANSQELVEQVELFAKDDRIRAVLVRIDSPGGAVAPSQEIYTAIKELRKKKKVVASLGSVAASGGYMIACAADKIVANPGTITGSISVIMYFANAEDLMKKIGITASVVKSGKYKDIGSPTRAMRPDEKQILQTLVDDIYDQFIGTVSTDRKMPKEDVKQLADGRVFSGRQAATLKLVDYLGDRTYAVRLAAQMAGLKGSPDLVYAKKKELSFWDFIMQRTATTFAGALKEKIAPLPTGVNMLYEYGL